MGLFGYWPILGLLACGVAQGDPAAPQVSPKQKVIPMEQLLPHAQVVLTPDALILNPKAIEDAKKTMSSAAYEKMLKQIEKIKAAAVKDYKASHDGHEPDADAIRQELAAKHREPAGDAAPIDGSKIPSKIVFPGSKPSKEPRVQQPGP